MRQLLGGQLLKTDLPLGLPRGSIRAIITLAIVGAAAVRWATGEVVGEQLALAVGVVLTYYFNSRQKADVVEADIPPLPTE